MEDVLVVEDEKNSAPPAATICAATTTKHDEVVAGQMMNQGADDTVNSSSSATDDDDATSRCESPCRKKSRLNSSGETVPPVPLAASTNVTSGSSSSDSDVVNNSSSNEDESSSDGGSSNLKLLSINNNDASMDTTSSSSTMSSDKVVAQKPSAHDNDAEMQEATQKDDGQDDWMEVDDDKQEQEAVALCSSSDEEFDFDESDDDDDSNDSPGDGGVKSGIAQKFDMKLLQHSIESGTPALESVVDKDVVLVCGKTGTGKSTLITGAIAGRKLFETTHVTTTTTRTSSTKTFAAAGLAQEMIVEKRVFAAEQPLEGFEIGHVKESKTRHINSLVSKHGKKGTDLVYLDSPGFEDTGGHEIDIATSVMLRQVAKQCRSLRFVILINYVSLLEDRGGAMRAVLKLVRSFVPDFEARKTSFMFLFTHTNEIKDIPDTLNGARECLQHEIIRTMEGTKDEHVQAVLEFMRKSLKKKFPFVDIFHPLKSDLPKLVANIEKLKPAEGLHLGSNCGLSLTSQLKLSGELQNLLQHLRSILQNESPDLVVALDVFNTFRSFEKYIDTEEVRKAISEAGGLFGNFIQQLCETVRGAVERGTGSMHEFGPADAAHLKTAISSLKDLSETFPGKVDMGTLGPFISDEVVKFQKQLFLSRGQCFTGMHQRLKKLQTWSETFPDEFQGHYTATLEHLSALIRDTVADTEAFHTTCLEAASTGVLECYIRDLGVLASIKSSFGQLSACQLDVKRAADTYMSSVARLQSALEDWGQNAIPDMKATGMDENGLGIFVAKARTVERLHAILETNAIDCSDLTAKAASIRENFATEASEYFGEACLDFLAGDCMVNPANCQVRLETLRKASDLLQSIGGRQWEHQVSSAYSAVVEKIKSILKTTSGELHAMAKSVTDQGIGNGLRDAHALQTFVSFKFFDGFLPTEDQFVENCSIAYSREFRERILKLVSVVDKFLAVLFDDEDSSTCTALRSLKPLLPELSETSYFSAVLDDKDLLRVKSSAEGKILQYVEAMASRTENDLTEWRALTERNEDLQSMTDKLVKTLCELGLLGELELDHSCHSRAASICAKIHGTFEDFGKDVLETAASDGHYDAKEAYLSALVAIDSVSRERGLRLPDIQKVKERVRNSVAADAQKIETMISQTSEWDEIDRLIHEFEGATVLDQFTSNEASSRLHGLRQLRNQKEAQVDDLLKQLIADQDYSGIGDFLKPLAKSQDQLKKQKFDRCRKMIGTSLTEIIDDLQRRLDFREISESDARMIVSGFGKLEEANHELGSFFKTKKRGLCLKERLVELKKKVSRKLTSLIKKVNVAAGDPIDYVELGTNHVLATEYFDRMKNILPPNTRNVISTEASNYRGAKRTVSSLVDKFFEDASFEASDLLPALSSLEAASLHDAPSLPEMAALYAESKTRFTDQLKDAFATAKDHVSQTGCYDDAISTFGTLKRQLETGLADHLSSPTLLSDLTSQLDIWQEDRRGEDRRLFGADVSLETVEEWKKRMDRLDPSSWANKFSTFFGVSTYDRTRKQVQDLVANRKKRGMAALKSHDYGTVQECICVLDRIDKSLREHIKSAGKAVTDLKLKALGEFTRLCSRIKRTLESERRNGFQEAFGSYSRMILNVNSVMLAAESHRKFALTNQLIFEALSGDIARLDGWKVAFDFAALKSQIESLRAFGGFVADHCTLFYEDVKCCEHVAEDKWLSSIYQLCLEHFNCGRDLSRIRLYSVLGVPPSATKKEIKKAYHNLAKKEHPDKRGGDDSAFRKIKEAWDELEKHAPTKQTTERPFDTLLKGIREVLRTKVRDFLAEQRYGEVEQLLFRLGGLHELDTLVRPSLESRKTNAVITELVRCHVEKIKVEVDTNWAERQYRALNDNITDLKAMEAQFKNYPKIFPDSWNNGIVGCVEGEIETLGAKARDYLRDGKTARENLSSFRQCFIGMGSVMVELPPFKEFTKAVMCSVLESVLGFDWGYSFLFEFGLNLQRGDDSSSEEENVVAQVIIGEFSHFKEVMTMAWNEETSQKPADDTVKDIRGHRRKAPLRMNKNMLLDSFKDFDGQYKALLGEYIVPEADLNALVQKIVASADELKPLSCDSGWGDNAKRKIPHLLAGVFAVFTILKSGASYNRLGSTEGAQKIGENLLMKPHNIQVLTLLCMFGCGSSSGEALESQLLQIRTGEGKSMILGAAAVVLGLLGFRVRCVCYSEYLSSRDFGLFKDVFCHFRLTEYIKYSKITTLSEDTTAAKGNIRKLTEDLLHGQVSGNPTNASSRRQTGRRSLLSSATDSDALVPGDTNGTVAAANSSTIAVKRQKKRGRSTREASPPPVSGSEEYREEILLVDEVDVFFGAEFYGQTYNQVSQIKEPEVAEILQHIWNRNTLGGRRQRLADIQQMPVYSQLLQKLPGFKFLVDSEISSMIGQVHRVDEEPYYLDRQTDRIGYKVMDTISYEATYGYRTAFAYLREAEKGNLRNMESTLANVLAMSVSCGQFSYANISPSRILGVSGTLDAMGDYENAVLAKYGVETFMFVPSVYGQSNFNFDKAGEGIRIESGVSDYFHSITNQIQKMTKAKRSVIVFFRDKARMQEFTNSPFYRKLGRQKKVLSEEMTAADKEFVISKAATAGQVTIATAVFGRGTDFFCKDDRVQKSGGVHVIQAFLSAERSEEIQIQGRTARQGKDGSYQMILLESDLKDHFGIPLGAKDNVRDSDRYKFLCDARDKHHAQHCQEIEQNLVEATKFDMSTHRYFDALLAGNQRAAQEHFKEIYSSFKKKSMPSSMDIDLAFAVDVTGSMGPYASCARDTIKSILCGNSSIVGKLESRFPDIEFQVRLAFLFFRDIDDKTLQFQESTWRSGAHFTENIADATRFVDKMLASPSGGADIAEDHLGAIHRCANWNSRHDWTSAIKFMMLLTDAPAHGMVPLSSTKAANADSYPVRHPGGLTAQSVMADLIKRDIDLFFCTFNPAATEQTEKGLSQLYRAHPDNSEQREITVIPMVAQNGGNQRGSSVELTRYDESVGTLARAMPSAPPHPLTGGYGKHIIFVLDESGSMSNDWSGVVAAYNQYLQRRRQNQCESDLVSVVQFGGLARITVNMQPLSQAPSSLGYGGGGTAFAPAAQAASGLAQQTPPSHVPLVVFMSDGCAHDASTAATTFSTLNRRSLRPGLNGDLELHVIGFGQGVSTAQLAQIAGASKNGKVYSSADTAELSNIFVNIAGGQDVAGLLEAEVGKRISEAVADRLMVEYLG